MIGVLTVNGIIEENKTIEQQRIQEEKEFQQKYLELEKEFEEQKEQSEHQSKIEAELRKLQEEKTNINKKSLEMALDEQKRKLDAEKFSQSLEDAFEIARKTEQVQKPQTIIDKEEIKWTLYDSKGNQYHWTMPVTTYESLVQANYYPTMNLKLPNGKIVTVGDFSKYVKTSFKEVIDQVYKNSDGDSDFIYEVWYITSQLTVYSEDIGEDPRYALETLTRGGGDCEDTAILVADMLKSSSHSKYWKVQLVYFDSDNLLDPLTINHVAVSVNTDKNTFLIETTAKTNQGMNTWAGVEIYGYWFDV